MRLRASMNATTLKWGVWLIAGACFVLAAWSFVMPSVSPPFWGLLFFFTGQMLLLVVDEFVKRRTRAEWVGDWFGSYENFRSSLDTEELRRVKREQGRSIAVLLLRRDFPFLPLARIRELVDDL